MPQCAAPSLPIDHLPARCLEQGWGERPALTLRKRTLNFTELEQAVAHLSGWLKRQISDDGARIASWAGKGELTTILPLAAARAGFIHVPINPLLKKAQVAYILRDSGAVMLIANSGRIKSLEANDISENCTVVDEESALAASKSFDDQLPPSSAKPNDLAAILYTSGSTGKPKGVMLSHENLWLGAQSVAQYLKLDCDDVTLAVLPLSFDYGQNQLFSTWYAGGNVVPFDYLFARDVAKACVKHQITTLAAVPPLWMQLCEVQWPLIAVQSMRRLTNSGGALTSRLVRDLRKLFPEADLYPMYGLTEAFRSTFLDPELVDLHPTSMGTAIPFAEILIINEFGEITEPGEEGELVHCGPLVAKGYWQDPKRSKERFRPAPESSKWGGDAVYSGDRVRREENGLLYFVGRRDAMIKTSGNRVSPQEVEEVALAASFIEAAVAIGIPDANLGQSIQLIVLCDCDEGNLQALKKQLGRDLPNFMQPQMIHCLKNFPVNPNGKIDRAALERRLIETGKV